MVYIRADANPNIGMGHIMRCLSIADAFHTRGVHPVFIIADEQVLSLIRKRGYKAIVLHSNYADMKAELQCWDAENIGIANIIIIDSYYATPEYLKMLKTRVGDNGNVVYLDDRAAFPYPVDILVNYNAFAKSSTYESLYSRNAEHIPQLLLGCSYTPLRRTFQGIVKKEQPEKVKNILVSTGGSDKLHLSLALEKELQDKEGNDIKVYHFLLGAMNQDKAEIQRLAQGQKNLVLHENVTDMRSLLERMDLAVSAAGATLYEICACGVPVITYSIANNQIPGAEAFQSLGLAMNIGDLREANVNEIASNKLASSATRRIISAIEERSIDYTWRQKVGPKMQEMIDGFGADRLVEKILSL